MKYYIKLLQKIKKKCPLRLETQSCVQFCLKARFNFELFSAIDKQSQRVGEINVVVLGNGASAALEITFRVH